MLFKQTMDWMNYEVIKFMALFRYGGISNHPLLQLVDSTQYDAIAKRFCYSAKYKFTYLRIPKSANSTIVRTLIAHMPDIEIKRNAFLGRTRWKGKLRRLPSLSEFENSYTFSFIRDPAARVLSAYLDKVHTGYFQEKYQLSDPNNPSQPVSFSTFLERLEAGLLHQDLHWAPQSSILPSRGKAFDFIGRVENFDRDIEFVMKQIFGRFRGIDRRTSGVTNAGSKLDSAVSKSDRQRIEKLYADDYDAFWSVG